MSDVGVNVRRRLFLQLTDETPPPRQPFYFITPLICCDKTAVNINFITNFITVITMFMCHTKYCPILVNKQRNDIYSEVMGSIAMLPVGKFKAALMRYQAEPLVLSS